MIRLDFNGWEDVSRPWGLDCIDWPASRDDCQQFMALTSVVRRVRGILPWKDENASDVQMQSNKTSDISPERERLSFLFCAWLLLL